MNRRKFLELPPCRMPQMAEENQEKVIAASQILEVNGERAVEITLFYMGELKGRYFADEKTHNAWVDGIWYKHRIKNIARICKGEEPLRIIYYFCDEWKWASKEDKDRATDFLDNWSIDAYECKLAHEKEVRAIKRKKDRIANIMKEVPCVPDDVNRWMNQTVFPDQFLFIKRNGKRVTYHCTACGCKSWKKADWKHGEETTCPKCGAKVKVNSRQEERTRKEPVVIIQKYGQKWVERQFKAVCTWCLNGKSIQLLEQMRVIIPEGKCWGTVWYGLLNEADEQEQEFWDRNPAQKRFQKSFLYPENLDEVLPAGRLEYSGMINMAMAGVKFGVNRFIINFHAMEWIEYVIKAGLFQLAEDLIDSIWAAPKEINTKGKNLQEALGLDGNRVNRIKQLNGGIICLRWLQYEEKKEIKITQESLDYLTQNHLDISVCEEILRELKSVNRMVNYMKKQRINPGKIVTTWRDYLRMAREEGYDTEDDIVRIPKDLKERHDQLVEIRNNREDQERLKKYNALDVKIMARLPEAAKYFWENDQYMIIPAGNCEELMAEGRTLHHCVGSSDTYMRKMAEGTSWILFLRKKEDLEKPYYTIEIRMKDDQILQFYSEFDRQPDREKISKLLTRFKNSLRKPERVRVPAAIA